MGMQPTGIVLGNQAFTNKNNLLTSNRIDLNNSTVSINTFDCRSLLYVKSPLDLKEAGGSLAGWSIRIYGQRQTTKTNWIESKTNVEILNEAN